jgi:acyl carrier protein phosphodiesterase
LNYLAHQYLSFENGPVMLGNFIADSVRANKIEHFSPEIRLGIDIHRFIDNFTDHHRLPLESRKLLYSHFGKYAQVVQDVFYDHFLAKNWSNFHELPLPIFAEKVYLNIEAHQEWLDERSNRLIYYMKLQNWLLSYASTEGMDRALKGLSQRAKFASNMENALPALEQHYTALESQFEAFMPALKSAVQQAFGEHVLLQ